MLWWKRVRINEGIGMVRDFDWDKFLLVLEEILRGKKDMEEKKQEVKMKWPARSENVSHVQ